MNQKLQAVLDTLPDKQSGSRLEPYREWIGELRKRGQTYRQVAHLLATECGITVGSSTVHDFVRQDSRRSIAGNRSVPKPVGSNLVVRKPRQSATETALSPFHFDSDEPLRLSTRGKKGSAG